MIETPVPDSVSAIQNNTNPTRDLESELEVGQEGKIREIVVDNVDSEPLVCGLRIAMRQKDCTICQFIENLSFFRFSTSASQYYAGSHVICYLFVVTLDFLADIKTSSNYRTSNSDPKGRERRTRIITQQGEVAVYPTKARLNRSRESKHRPVQGNCLILVYWLCSSNLVQGKALSYIVRYCVGWI